MVPEERERAECKLESGNRVSQSQITRKHSRTGFAAVIAGFVAGLRSSLISTFPIGV